MLNVDTIGMLHVCNGQIIYSIKAQQLDRFSFHAVTTQTTLTRLTCSVFSTEGGHINKSDGAVIDWKRNLSAVGLDDT